MSNTVHEERVEKPIIFQPWKVKKILEWDWEQEGPMETRRVSGLEEVNKNPDLWDLQKIGILNYMTKPRYRGRFGAYFHSEQIEPRTLSVCPVICPYGQPGDLLYVREPWRIISWWPENGDWKIEYSDGSTHWFESVNEMPEEIEERYFIQCSDDCEKAGLKLNDNDEYHWEDGQAPTRKRPSIFLPKYFTRVWLEVVDVKVERIHQVGGTSAWKEGEFTVQQFKETWNEINAKRGFGWDVNPWVWVVSYKLFERIQP